MDAADLNYVARRLKAHAERALGAQEGDVERVPVQHQLVLGSVMASPGAAIGDIARRLSIAQSAVSTAVASLRDQDLVVTEPDPDDRRVTRVAPSDRLQRWASARLHVDVEEVMSPVLAGLSVRDRSCVLRALLILRDAFRRQDDRPGYAR